MRIWLIQRAESTPHDEDGERRLLRVGILADILHSKGHEVIWWTSAFDHVGKRKRFKSSMRVMVKKNYYIHYIKCFGYKKNISISRFIDNLFVAFHFKKDLRNYDLKPDIILTSVPSIELSKVAVKYANKFNIPIVLDIRDLWPDVFFEILPKHKQLIVKFLSIFMRNSLVYIARNSTAISGITDNFVEWGIKHSGRKREKKDVFFPMAYVKKKISKNRADDANNFWKKYGIVKNDKILNVLFLGVFTESFEFETIFSAAEILESKGSPIRFIICGTGAKEKEIIKSCEKLKNCVYPGWINSSQIKTILQLSDVGLTPYIHTKNFTDNFPNKPAEYLSENLLLASNLKYGKLYDFIKTNDCGISYGSDPIKLAEFLENLSKDEKELNRLKNNAEKVFINQLDGGNVYSSMVGYLEKLTKN